MAKQSRNWARIKGPKFPTFHTFWLSAGHFGHVLLSFASFAALPERHGFALHTPSLPTLHDSFVHTPVHAFSAAEAVHQLEYVGRSNQGVAITFFLLMFEFTFGTVKTSHKSMLQT